VFRASCRLASWDYRAWENIPLFWAWSVWPGMGGPLRFSVRRVCLAEVRVSPTILFGENRFGSKELVWRLPVQF
jgi:hypothetical protein